MRQTMIALMIFVASAAGVSFAQNYGGNTRAGSDTAGTNTKMGPTENSESASATGSGWGRNSGYTNSTNSTTTNSAY